jgi:hypothetical protein
MGNMTRREDQIFRHASEIAERKARAARRLQGQEAARIAKGAFRAAARAVARLARRSVSAGSAASR